MKREVLVRTENLTRSFDQLIAVNNLNLEVYKGEIFGLVGPDGAGKTTTLRLLCGLLEPDSGTISVLGSDLSVQLEKIKEQIGYMAQGFGLYRDLTVEENMFFYSDLFGLSPRRRQELMPRLLAMTRMGPFLHRQAGRLSGGMQQKLALMCTLLHEPQALLLDEPTTGVDPVSRRDFWKILYELVKDGLTVFVTTAYLDEAERCNRVGLMYQGELIRCDSPHSLIEESGRNWFQVQCADPRRAKDHLTGQDGVVSVETSGAAVHLLVSPSLSPEEVKIRLEQQGLGPARVQPIRPSLEDVFIFLVRRHSSEGS